ncbi:hypothetical protein D9M68_757570 [compost metagenome]
MYGSGKQEEVKHGTHNQFGKIKAGQEVQETGKGFRKKAARCYKAYRKQHGNHHYSDHGGQF